MEEIIMKRSASILMFSLTSFLLLSSCQLLSSLNLRELFSSAQREPLATPTQEPIATTTPNSLNTSMYLTEVTRGEESEEFAYTIKMTHPQLENAGLQNDIFNHLVNVKLLESVNEFRGFAEETYEEMKDIGTGSYYRQDYTVYRFDERFISILFSVESYIIGAAHPGTSHFVVNYDLTAQQEISIGGLFLPDSNILNVLQFYCTEELNNRYPEGYFENGLQTIAENYRNWNLAKEGLVLTFETYQVQAGAAGPQTVLIPYYLLEEFINPEGPLGYVVEQQNQEINF
jgi:hypothetical protein